MFTTTRKSHLLTLLLAVLLLAFLTSACGHQVYKPGQVTQDIDIRITEAMLQRSSSHITFDGQDSLLDEVTRVELHDGFLRFLGTHTRPDGSVVPGSVDLYLGTQDDRLVARVIAVHIPGIEMDDPLVVEINRELKVELAQGMAESEADLRFIEVKVMENELRMRIQVTVLY